MELYICLQCCHFIYYILSTDIPLTITLTAHHHLLISFNLLNSTIQLLYKGREDDCERVKELVKLQDQEVSNLKNELENEKKTVHKFVAQNVERQREIVKLKRELAQSTTLHTQDRDKRLNNRASTAEKENEDPLKDRSVQIGIGT